jgi:hypothetical protein
MFSICANSSEKDSAVVDKKLFIIDGRCSLKPTSSVLKTNVEPAESGQKYSRNQEINGNVKLNIQRIQFETFGQWRNG